MGLHGPPPTPTAINTLRGNPGKRPPNPAEPKARRILPPGVKPSAGSTDIPASRFKPPAHMEPAAVAEWKRLVPILARMKVLSEVDGPLLASICMLSATIAKADALLQELEKLDKTAGLLYKASSGYVQQSPLIGIRNNAIAEHAKLLLQFGMSPSSRARIVTGDEGTPRSTGVLNGEWRRSG